MAKQKMPAAEPALTLSEMAAADRRMELAIQLVKARKAAKLSQTALATLAGYGRSTLARTELGITDPSLTAMLEFLLPLGKTLAIVPLSELENEKEEEQ